MLPLYEGKMVDLFNPRAADVVKSATAVNRQNQPSYLTESDLRDPERLAQPLNWIAETGRIRTTRKGKEVAIPGADLRLAEVKWKRGWLTGWCDVTASTNERTAIMTLLPKVAVGNTIPLMFPGGSAELTVSLIAAQSSLVFDFVARQKISGIHLGLMTWKQLPVPHPDDLARHTPFVTSRTLELVYTAWDMEPLARDLGDTGTPYIWKEERRAQLRAELDAYFFHLYGVSREDTDYILESFQTENGGLKHNEIAKYGEYRTKRLVLAEYDRMATAGLSLENPLVDGENYASALTPPPGHGPRHPA